jgi:hypothetical protein
MSIKIQGEVVIYDDKVFQLGSGTTEQRPESPAVGMLWFNTELSSFEGYDGAAWGAIGGGGGGEDEFARTIATLGL